MSFTHVTLRVDHSGFTKAWSHPTESWVLDKRYLSFSPFQWTVVLVNRLSPPLQFMSMLYGSWTRPQPPWAAPACPALKGACDWGSQGVSRRRDTSQDNDPTGIQFSGINRRGKGFPGEQDRWTWQSHYCWTSKRSWPSKCNTFWPTENVTGEKGSLVH